VAYLNVVKGFLVQAQASFILTCYSEVQILGWAKKDKNLFLMAKNKLVE
jgi:hypothetical protein